MPNLVIATRESPLALAQAERVRAMLADRGTRTTLLRLSTEGDERLDAPLPAIGGKGLFVKALEAALLDGRAQLAAHSMKDMPAEQPDGLVATTAGPRADARDALVAPGGATFDALPDGACIGTSSLRRAAFLRLARPDLKFSPARGNVGTRLRKLDAGQFDALVLACAGLDRLRLAHRVAERVEPDAEPAGRRARGIGGGVPPPSAPTSRRWWRTSPIPPPSARWPRNAP